MLARPARRERDREQPDAGVEIEYAAVGRDRVEHGGDERRQRNRLAWKNASGCGAGRRRSRGRSSARASGSLHGGSPRRRRPARDDTRSRSGRPTHERVSSIASSRAPRRASTCSARSVAGDVLGELDRRHVRPPRSTSATAVADRARARRRELPRRTPHRTTRGCPRDRNRRGHRATCNRARIR